MKVRLDQIHDEPFIWHETVKLPVAELDRPELVDLSEIDCQGRIQRFDLDNAGGRAASGRARGAFGPGDYLLRVRLGYRQTLACDRCLAPIEEPVAAELDLMIETTPPPRHQAEEEVELGEDDLGVLHVEGDVLDTKPLIAEQVQLNIPMKPLCRPDCQGLCPRCGADLNQSPCGCEEPQGDPRWAALSALKRDA